VQVKWVLNKKREDLPRSRHFDGIALDDDGVHERPDVPRHFAVCSECYSREGLHETGTGQLPKHVSVSDLAREPCCPTGAEVEDKVRPPPLFFA
jgi:hypothetical protein